MADPEVSEDLRVEANQVHLPKYPHPKAQSSILPHQGPDLGVGHVPSLSIQPSLKFCHSYS